MAVSSAWRSWTACAAARVSCTGGARAARSCAAWPARTRAARRCASPDVGRSIDDVATRRLVIFGGGEPVQLPAIDGYAWDRAAIASTELDAPRAELQRRMREAESRLCRGAGARGLAGDRRRPACTSSARGTCPWSASSRRTCASCWSPACMRGCRRSAAGSARRCSRSARIVIRPTRASASRRLNASPWRGIVRDGAAPVSGPERRGGDRRRSDPAAAPVRGDRPSRSASSPESAADRSARARPDPPLGRCAVGQARRATGRRRLRQERRQSIATST